MFTPQQKRMQVRGMQVAASPLDFSCERPVTYQETLTNKKENNIHISLRVNLVSLPESCLAYLLRFTMFFSLSLSCQTVFNNDVDYQPLFSETCFALLLLKSLYL